MGGRIEEMEMGTRRQVDDRSDDVLQPFEREERAAEGQGDESREPASGLGSEGQRARPLQSAEVDLAAMVHAVKCAGQLVVGTQERIAPEEFPRAGEVRQLDRVPGDRVAEVADPEEAADHDQVEQLLDQLPRRRALGGVVGPERDAIEDLPDPRPEPVADGGRLSIDRRDDQPLQFSSCRFRTVEAADPPRRGSEVFEDHHLPLVEHRPAERPAARGGDPADEVDRRDGSLAVEAGLLEVIEQTRLARPMAAGRRVEQGRERSLPPPGFGRVGGDDGAEPTGERIDLAAGRRPLARGVSARQESPGLGPEDRRADVIPPRGRGHGRSSEPRGATGAWPLRFLVGKLALGLLVRHLRHARGAAPRGRTGEARRLEQGFEVDVLGQERKDRVRVRDGGKRMREDLAMEGRELEIDRCELHKGRPVVGRED